ncbi:hypothetical protein DKT69_08865 [Micromonospora sicca]|uniref:ADP-ribosylglycohydrolase n=2 Tax=Micromonosporaceae TaxID=28056 RepID=A0A317DSH9_9ACTN|nr:hypothetical protein DKT69_08865 [Micromonospora sp. 4G51]
MIREMTKVTAEQLATARGCVLGLMLGDAIGATGGNVPASGPLLATSAGQLACFTIDGLIRAHIRGMHKGISSPPIVVWRSYTRWAAIQGIPGLKVWDEADWPNGWLTKVPALAERRGSAPATVATLQGQTMGSIDKPAGKSIGAHALTRTLPVALGRPLDPAAIAALTHGGEALAAARLGVEIVRLVASGEHLDAAVDRVLPADEERSEGAVRSLALALAAARSRPGQRSELARLAPDAKAASALAGGLYVALSFPDRKSIRDALLFAASANDGGHVATVAGTLLGTTHGPDALPVDWLSRLELAWPADTLARDFVTEIEDSPSGGDYVPATDPHWWSRYPGG